MFDHDHMLVLQEPTMSLKPYICLCSQAGLRRVLASGTTLLIRTSPETYESVNSLVRELR